MIVKANFKMSQKKTTQRQYIGHGFEIMIYSVTRELFGDSVGWKLGTVRENQTLSLDNLVEFSDLKLNPWSQSLCAQWGFSGPELFSSVQRRAPLEGSKKRILITQCC